MNKKNKINKIEVLDDGFVRLVDIMGDDASIVQAARVSYGKGTKTISDDRKLIRYLMRHEHTSPFEMVELKFHVRAPMDTWRQWIRHRTASVNEYSTRYSEAIDSCYTLEPDEWRTQSSTNKQGSSGIINPEIGSKLTDEQNKLHDHAKRVYRSNILKGVARELARKDLPLSTYTEAYWKIDLKNLLHFLKLRMNKSLDESCNKAQYEIAQYANAISKIVAERFPDTWEAFVDYKLKSITFSYIELMYLKDIIDEYAVEDFIEQYGGYNKPYGKASVTREAQEFIDKIKVIMK